jgi:hypothetical protein
MVKTIYLNIFGIYIRKRKGVFRKDAADVSMTSAACG